MATFPVKLLSSELFLWDGCFLCICPVCVEWTNIQISGLMPKFGKQLFPCLWAYSFISESSLPESVLSSPLEGGVKYACTLHFRQFH